MGIVLRQSVKGSIAQYFGILIGYVNLLYVIPYCLSPEENGLFRFVLESATFFALFAQAGIPNAIPRFGPEFKKLGQEAKLIRFSLSVPIVSTLLFGIAYLLFFRAEFNQQISSKSPDFLSYEFWIFPMMLAIIYQNILENLIANYYRITVSKLVREVFLRVGISIACLLTVYFALDLKSFLGTISFIYMAGALILLLYLWRLYSLFRNTEPSKSGLLPWKQIWIFMSLILISGLGTNLVNKLDIFMVSSQIGLTDNAIYTTAFMITMVMEVPSRSFHQIMAPIISEATHEKNHRKIAWAYKKSSTGQLIAGLLILSLLLLNARWIFLTMPNSEIYSLGYILILFLGLAKLFDAFTGINGLILANSKYYYVGIYFTIALAIIAVILNLVFIPVYGLNGVAYATALSILLYNLIMSVFVWFKFQTHPFSKSSLYLGFFGLLSILILWIQYQFEFISFLQSVLLTIVYLILFVALLLKYPLLKEIRKSLASIRSRIRI